MKSPVDWRETLDRDFGVWLKLVQRSVYDDPVAHINMVKLAQIEALAFLEHLAKKPVKRGVRSEVVRAAYGRLEWCTNSGSPPPPALTELIGLLLNVRPAISQKKNPEKFQAAALFKAENPGATASKIKKEVGVSSRQIKEWLADPLFEAAGAYAVELKKHLDP